MNRGEPSNESDAPPVTASEPSGLRFVLRSLNSRNYRLFFGGQIVSLVGTWLTQVAMSWLVYRLTHSPSMLGLIGFAGQFPAFLIGPFAGVLVDRWPLRRTLVATQTLSMIQSFLLAWFALRHTITEYHVLCLALMQGLINAVDIPARQAFVVQMVNRREDLPNAIALNSSMVNAARLVGPSVAGILIAAVGEGWCFLLDGISYIGVIVALLAMVFIAPSVKRARTPVLASFMEGFAISFGFPPFRAILLLLALVSLAGVPYMVLMPIFAEQILHGGPKTLGVLVGCAGFGALVGALYLASRRTVLGLGRVVPLAAGMFGVGLILFSLSQHVWLSMLILPITGGCMIVQMAGSNTLLQTLVDDDKRGRVMSFFAMSFMGTVPLGSLLAGKGAELFGAPATVRMGGVVCILGAIAFNRARPKLRVLVDPIYIKRGILPAVAAGLQATSAATQAASE